MTTAPWPAPFVLVQGADLCLKFKPTVCGLLEVRHLEHPLGHHEPVVVIAVTQVGDDHAGSIRRGVNHFAIPQIDARVSHGVAGPAEKEDVARQQLGVIQGCGSRFAPPRTDRCCSGAY